MIFFWTFDYIFILVNRCEFRTLTALFQGKPAKTRCTIAVSDAEITFPFSPVSHHLFSLESSKVCRLGSADYFRCACRLCSDPVTVAYLQSKAKYQCRSIYVLGRKNKCHTEKYQLNEEFFLVFFIVSIGWTVFCEVCYFRLSSCSIAGPARVSALCRVWYNGKWQQRHLSKSYQISGRTRAAIRIAPGIHDAGWTTPYGEGRTADFPSAEYVVWTDVWKTWQRLHWLGWGQRNGSWAF